MIVKNAIIKVPGMKKVVDANGIEKPPLPSHGHGIDDFINKLGMSPVFVLSNRLEYKDSIVYSLSYNKEQCQNNIVLF